MGLGEYKCDRSSYAKEIDVGLYDNDDGDDDADADVDVDDDADDDDGMTMARMNLIIQS